MKLDGTKLRTARLQRGLNQGEVAKKLKLSIVTISNAEKEKSVYPVTARKICDFFHRDLAEMMLPITKNGDGDAA